MKETILIILIILLIYVLPLVFAYRFVRIAHSKNGRWSNLSPEVGDFLITIIPILNLLTAFTSPYPENKRGLIWSKFFKINKN